MRSFTVLLSLFLAVSSRLALAQQQGSETPRDSAIQQIIKHVCSDGGVWLKCYSLEPASCYKVTEGYVRPCVDKVLSGITEELKGQQEIQTMQRLLGCFNDEFMRRYGAGQLKSNECAQPPAHLR